MKIRQITIFLLFPLLLFWGAAGTAAARESGKSPIDLGLGAGFGHSEIRGGLLDLMADVRLSLAPNLRLGVGVGYLTSSHHMGTDRRGGMMGGGMMDGGMMGGLDRDMDQGVPGFRNSLRSIPLTATAYYSRPIGRALDLYLLGGGGYYITTFRDLTSQTKSSFGPHLGLGLDFKVARKVLLSAEALYRFVTVKHFKSETRPGYLLDAQGQRVEGFWSYDHMTERFQFHMSGQDQDAIGSGLQPFDVRLSGFALRVGLRLGF